MPVDAWLSLSFTLPLCAAYGLWCAGWLPRIRNWLTWAGVLAFVVPVVVHDLEPPSRDDARTPIAHASATPDPVQSAAN